MRITGDESTINDASNPDCPACQAKRIHVVSEWLKYHPHAGEGFSKEHGTPKPKERKD